MKVTRRFTKSGQDVFASVEWERRTSRISNPDGTVVFEMKDAEIPRDWSQLATDIMVSKYFRKAGVPQTDEQGQPRRDEKGDVIPGPERSARQVIRRLAGCWRHWGERHGYFDSAEDAQAFQDELSYMLVHQMCAPNSPQWFNTGLHWAYDITGPAQGHYYCDPATGEMRRADNAYEHPQPHACFIQSVSDDLVNAGGIMDLWTREARLFKYGSGTGSNFSRLRGENEPLSGGGKSSGLMSFLKIGDRAAGAIKSGGTTRRAAKMVCLDLDHPDIEAFVNWKVREELKVAALVEGLKALPAEHRDLARRLGLKLDFDFNGEAYFTVSGQNSNNSVRIPNAFFEALEKDGDWKLYRRTDGKLSRSLKARDLWDQIAFAAWRCADPGVQYDTTINQWHTCPSSGRINASNPCVSGDTRVLCPGGVWRRIDQMIHLPSRVITNLDGQQVSITDGAFPTGLRPVVDLETESGYRLTLTPDHKVWTRRRGWVAAGDLTREDEVRLPFKPATDSTLGEPQDPMFFQLVGLLLSSTNGHGDALHLDACVDPATAASFRRYIAEHWSTPQCSDAAPAAEDARAATATLTHRRLLSRLRAYARSEAGQRRLSDDAFTAGLAAQKHLLRGLFSADGALRDGGIELRHPSLPLLRDVQLLLLGFGIKSALFAPTSGDGGAVRIGALSDRGHADSEAGSSTMHAHAHAERHGLRVDCGSLRSFARHIALLPGERLERLADAVALAPQRVGVEPNHDRVASVVPAGTRQVFDLTEPVTHSFIAGGLTVHNCSEYMFLDDTACNLASLNVLRFFDGDSGRFDIEGYRHGIRLWTIVLEISVLMASFPSEEIARLSHRFRTLGLGYANLGAMLMQAGIPYDSERGRAVGSALTAILTGESYAASAEMARELGAFPGLEDNRAEMLRVMRNHRRAAYNVASDAASRRALGDYEALDIPPVGLDATQFQDNDPLCARQLLLAARECWDRALFLGERHGYRNAQATVIAPTGTIGLLMDCDTTGVEPDFALVKFKKLAGGGYFKIANQSLRPALQNLGYTAEQISDVLRYVLGTLSLENAPHINRVSLKSRGLNDADIDAIEASLPGVFEIGFAFSPWSMPPQAMTRLSIAESEWSAPGFNLLKRLGFKKRQIEQANDVVCGRGTVEGAPHLRPEHYAVFDCANRCGRHGKRFIAVEGHIRMMAAVQPFISGAISKTINLPTEATVEDIKNSYFLSWKLGLKANALYRDGSKLSQPLNVSADADLDDEESPEDVEAALEEVASSAADAAARASEQLALQDRNLVPLEPAHTHIIEKIVERIVERPLRRRLPETRNAVTHKFDVSGHEGYITIGLYEDGQPGEMFITMAKEGSTIGGLMDCIATLVSVALQYGVPVESLVRKFEHVRFEPSGPTRNGDIPFAKSIIDYIFRWMAMEFVPGYRAANAPQRAPRPDPSRPVEAAPRGADAATRNGNGSSVAGVAATTGESVATAKAPRLALLADPQSQQSSELQSDAPACDVCGAITVRSGTCYKCRNCGNSMGCS